MALNKVTNLALNMCKIRDFLEQDEFDVVKFCSRYHNIEKFLYDVDRQISRALKDEFYQLDFTSEDMLALADVSQSIYNKIRHKCSFKCMENKVKSMQDIKEFIAWQQEQKYWSHAVTSTQGMHSAFSYMALLVKMIEEQKKAESFEFACLDAILSILKEGKESALSSV